MGRYAGFINKHKSLVLYMLFGILTTVVNYLVYFPLLYVADLSAATSNIIAWITSVLFSFFTNKPFVFGSHDWSFSTLAHELAAFFSCRILTGALETLVLYISVDLLGSNGFIWKLAISAAIVLLNYIGNKIFVFHKK